MGKPVVTEAAGMMKILRFLADYCAFLFLPGRFRFVDSESSKSFGGDAFVVLESDTLRLRFVDDRDDLTLDVQAVFNRPDDPWPSFDLVQWLVSGERPDSSLLKPDKAKFLEEHLAEVERLFSSDRAAETMKELGQLGMIRARERYG